MAVVARMKVVSITLNGWNTTVKLQPVVPAENSDPHAEEIKAFFEATPTGLLEMGIRNEVAAEQFQPRDEFYVSLEKIRSADG